MCYYCKKKDDALDVGWLDMGDYYVSVCYDCGLKHGKPEQFMDRIPSNLMRKTIWRKQKRHDRKKCPNCKTTDEIINEKQRELGKEVHDEL